MAIVTIVLATAARAESGLQSARAYATPVIQFLSETHNAQTAAVATDARSLHARSGHRPSAGDDMWTAMLPVLFVGLVSPLSLISAHSHVSLDRIPATPSLALLFQRPPPAHLL
ncbi:MAG TPA: hypothetical protein VHN81_10845 [Edaphobacter sp.]|nr:hypothetical protein [Edaphobacter sp.]